MECQQARRNYSMRIVGVINDSQQESNIAKCSHQNRKYRFDDTFILVALQPQDHIAPKEPIWIELIGVLRCKISHSLQCTTGYGKLDQLLPRCLTPKDIQRPDLPSFCCCLQISGPRRHGHSLSFFMSEFVTLLTPHQLHALTQLPLIYSDLNFSPCGRPTPSAI